METIKTQKQLKCPSCGYPLPIYFKYSKLIRCPSCGSDIFLEDEAVKVMGKSSVLSDEPSLIKLHKVVEIEGREYIAVGHLRFTTGPYFWDEWWMMSDGEGYWISVDDGDYILEREIKYSLSTTNPEDFKLGREFGEWIVTEIGEGICEGFEGELPEIIKPGDKYLYAHLSRSDGEMMTVEFLSSGARLYRGEWLDPYEIRVKE